MQLSQGGVKLVEDVQAPEISDISEISEIV